MKKTYYKLYTGLNEENNKVLREFFSEITLENSYIAEFTHKEEIQKEDSELRYLYFIIEGKAKILKNERNGKRIILQFLEKEEFIGDLTVIGAEEMTKDVVSIGETICLAIPVSYVTSTLMNDISFLKMIGKYIGQKLLKRTDHFSVNQTYELKYRLAKVLIIVSKDGIYNENHGQIAEYLGVSYRHFLHTLKKLREEGYLSKNRYGSGYSINHAKLELLIAEVENS